MRLGQLNSVLARLADAERLDMQCGFAVGTPKGKDWVWRKFISSRKVSHYHCVPARPFDNRAILGTTPDFYERLEASYDEKFYRQELLGEYLDMYSGAVYHGFGDGHIRAGLFKSKLP